ncbi:unnamed protein product, partial [Prorocentrum cordatum]
MAFISSSFFDGRHMYSRLRSLVTSLGAIVGPNLNGFIGAAGGLSGLAQQVTDCAVLELGAQWAPAALVLVWVFGFLWGGGGTWQARIVVGPATREELSDIMEIEASAQQESDGKIWYLLSPDLDVYPVLVDAPDLRGYEILDNDGSVLLRSGLRRGGRPACGSEWVPTARELVDAMEAVSPQRQPERRMTKKGPLLPTEAAAQTPTDLVNIVTGSERLPDVKPLRWYVTAGPNKSEIDGLFPRATVDEFARSDDVAIAVVGTGVYTLRALDPKDGVAQVIRDDRLLAMAKDSSGIRKKLFRDAVQEVTESPWPGWPLLGPRTAAWCVRFNAEQDSHPRARHTKWLHETGLTQADLGVADHEVAMRAFEFGLVYDQVNVGELVSFELLARRAQMAEWRYRDRLAPRRADETAEDEHLYMGTGETRGLIMMAPFLVEHISTELHRESQVMKEKRKLREERQLAKGTGADGDMKDALRKKVESQAAELRRLQQQGGKGGPAGGRDTGGRGANKPGYSSMPVKPAAFQRDLVALPSPGAKCDGASILQGEVPAVKPHCDAKLMQSKSSYASFVADLYDAGLVKFGSLRESTLGIFFVPKSDGKLRLIFDTRCVNQLFEPPAHAALPTAGCWKGLLLEPNDELCLSQVDVERATPSLVGQTAAAVYVDGVAVIGTQSAQTVQDCRAIAEALLAVGLVTKDMELPQDEQPFTGLIFEKGSGRISLSRSRIWRIRRAFQYAAEADKLTGVQMRMLLGHYTWAAMLRRPLLSVFAACYSFAEKAGDMAWRPWATVRHELRLSAALVAMAFVDLRRPVAAAVLATDASGGARQVRSVDPDLSPPGLEPAAACDYGGFGVVSREVSRCAVAAARQLSEKWRSSVPSLNLVLRRLAAISIIANIDITVRWIPSELNPADAPSRLPAARAQDARLDLRSFGGRSAPEPDDDSLWRAAAEELAAEGRPRRRDPGLAGLGDAAAPAALAGGFGLRRGGVGVQPDDSSDSDSESEPAASSTSSSPSGAGHGEESEPTRTALTYLQARKIRASSNVHFVTSYRNFDIWCQAHAVPVQTASEIDRAISEYMDVLYFDGMPSDVASKTIAAVRHFRPAAVGESELAASRAALKGFRLLAPARARQPLVREAVFCLIGLAMLDGESEFAEALSLAWDTALRLPSDLMQLRSPSLVPPQPRMQINAWSLLLHPEETGLRSKGKQFDEGVQLTPAGSKALGPVLARLRERFGQLFRKYAEMINLKDPHTCRVRHGSASWDIASGTRSLEAVQARLRHASATSTQRHSRAARCTAELALAPESVKTFGAAVADQWALTLR